MSVLKDQWKQFLPNIAVSGNFFRTVAFVHPAAEQMQVWQEAIEHPLTNQWQISEVWRRPNTGGKALAETDMVEDGKTVAGNLGLVTALERLGEFEIAQAAMGYNPVGLTKVELGDEHAAQFAKNEGCLLLKGKVYPVVNGRIVSDGVLPDGAREEAKTARVERHPVHVAGRLDLSHLFRSHAQVQDFSRLLDIQCDRNKWKSFVTSMDDIVERLDKIQYSEFRKTKISKMLLLIDDPIKGQSEFLESIKLAKEKLRQHLFLNDAQRAMCNNFFNEALLSYEIAYAKFLFNKFNLQESKNSPEGKELTEQTARVAKFCKQYGGSEADIQRINAEIIKGNHITLEKENILDKLTDLQINKSGIYFMPNSLFQTLVALREITEIMDRAVRDERGRIVRLPHKAPEPKV